MTALCEAPTYIFVHVLSWSLTIYWTKGGSHLYKIHMFSVSYVFGDDWTKMVLSLNFQIHDI